MLMDAWRKFFNGCLSVLLIVFLCWPLYMEHPCYKSRLNAAQIAKGSILIEHPCLSVSYSTSPLMQDSEYSAMLYRKGMYYGYNLCCVSAEV